MRTLAALMMLLAGCERGADADPGSDALDGGLDDVVVSGPLDAYGKDVADGDLAVDGEEASDCVQVYYPDVKVYPGDIQADSTGRPCLCYPRGTACYLYGDESTQPILGPESSKECPTDEVCDGWMTDAGATGGYCLKPCYHPGAGTKNSGLGCAPGEYCNLLVFPDSETHSFRAGFCWRIPDPVVDDSQCPEEPYCKPGTPDCTE